MRGTPALINRALLRPVLMAGVEKRLMLANCLLCFPLVAVTHLRFPACLVGVALFGVIHVGLRYANKQEPAMGALFKRATYYYWQGCFAPISHPQCVARNVKTLP